MRKVKKAFIFSFLALFVSFLIFGYASYKLYTPNKVSTFEFQKARMDSVNNEIKYFKNVYLVDALKYSSYTAVKELLNYSQNPSNYVKLNHNYTKLNDLLFESITNESMDSVHYSNLKNSSIYYFYDIFEKNFKENYKGNFSFKLLNMNVYEENPFYLKFQFLYEYNVTLDDNLSTWNSKDDVIISYPVFNLDDPEFLLQNKEKIPIRPFELYNTNINWDNDSFINAINNSYSTIFLAQDYKYTLGNSFLNSLLNESVSSYKDVLGFYSFDYDEKKNGVWDSSTRNGLAKDNGNTVLLLNFNNKNAEDLSGYNHSGVVIGNINFSAKGIYETGADFDGKSEIEINKTKLNLNYTNQISISAWIKPRAYVDSNGGGGSEIFRYGNDASNVIALRLDSNHKLLMEIGVHSNGVYHKFYSTKNISLNNWTNVIGIFNGDTGEGQLYINGQLDDLQDDFTLEKSAPISHFVKSGNNIEIGNIDGGNEHFNGTIDELGVYTKVLSSQEIADLYETRQAKIIDYKKSFHGKGLEFNGKYNFVNISSSKLSVNYFHGDFSIGTWFRIYNLSNQQTIYSKYYPFILYIKNKKLSAGIYTSDNKWHWINSTELKTDINYYSVVVWDSTNKKYSLYLNSKLMNSTTLSNSVTSTENNPIYLGMDKNSTTKGKYFFNGLIDEIKFYNKTLSKNEINLNYHNYDSSAKGCCNFLTLINPRKMGFNSTYYDKNISSNSRTFFDYYKLNKGYVNATVWELTNITTSDTTKDYYNFLVDDCMLQAYNLPYNQSVKLKVRHLGEDKGNCDNLIKVGLY